VNEEHVTYDRNQLYEEVWREPLRDVAKRYGVSDVALGKICRRLAVPTPGLGAYSGEFGRPVRLKSAARSGLTGALIGGGIGIVGDLMRFKKEQDLRLRERRINAFAAALAAIDEEHIVLRTEWSDHEKQREGLSAEQVAEEEQRIDTPVNDIERKVAQGVTEAKLLGGKRVRKLLVEYDEVLCEELGSAIMGSATAKEEADRLFERLDRIHDRLVEEMEQVLDLREG